MADNIDDMVKRIGRKYLGKPSPKEEIQERRTGFSGRIQNVYTRFKDFASRHKKKLVVGAAATVIVAGGVTALLALEFVTGRQNYPVRNVLYKVTDQIDVSGGSEEKGVRDVDERTVSQVIEGGIQSKVGTYFSRTVREVKDDVSYFNMDNTRKIRIASATTVPERVQAGLRVRGNYTFREQLAEIFDEKGKSTQKYYVYKFKPQRGSYEDEITILEHDDGTRTLENRMTEKRSFLIGWLWGKNFRAATFLDDYLVNSENKQSAKDFLEIIRLLNSEQTKERKIREKKIKEALSVADKLVKRPIYAAFEDGIIDLLSQESTIYLGHHPGKFERLKHWLGFGRHDKVRLRVENYWDLFPGRYPLLKNIPGLRMAFDKYNNGGYIIEDMYGEIAKIDIKDFVFFYGQDLLYSYYFDLNGDGKINEKNELIGQVLFHTTHDERVNLEKLIGEGKPKTDVSFSIDYTFMGPTPDREKSLAFFNLGGYIESFMPNEINRGFGKHSMLGYINQKRSDIMLRNNLINENMSRALTQESTLVAKYDIVRVLIAAKRPYAKEVAESFGIAKDFEGQYVTSDLLKERIELGPIPGTVLVLGALYVGNRYRKRRKQQRLAKAQ